MKLEELDGLCSVLKCTPAELMSPEPDKVAARRPGGTETLNGDDQGQGAGNGGVSPAVTPRFGKSRAEPPLYAGLS